MKIIEKQMTPAQEKRMKASASLANINDMPVNEPQVVTREDERGTEKMSFKMQHPSDIIGRALVLEQLRTVPVELIEKLSPKYDNFLIGKTSTIMDKDGKPSFHAKIDWEYALFEAPQKEILSLFSNFTKKRKDEVG